MNCFDRSSRNTVHVFYFLNNHFVWTVTPTNHNNCFHSEGVLVTKFDILSFAYLLRSFFFKFHQKLHHHMTKREIEYFFNVDDHDKG